MPSRRLLDRQVAKVTTGGELDVPALLALIEAAYAEKDLDRIRADRASHLMSEELEEAFAASQVQNLRFKAALDNMSQGAVCSIRTASLRC